jgi:hypothetical protein
VPAIGRSATPEASDPLNCLQKIQEISSKLANTEQGVDILEDKYNLLELKVQTIQKKLHTKEVKPHQHDMVRYKL